MDFDFTSEQLMLRQMARELFAAESSAANVRRLMETNDGYDPKTWKTMAEQGLLGITIPEQLGGQGLGCIEQTLVLEESGRAALPSPYFATCVLATQALLAGGSDEQKRRYLPGIADGAIIATYASLDAQLGGALAAQAPAARPDGDGWRLSGTAWLVPHAHIANVLVIAANTPKGATFFIVDAKASGVAVKLLETIDASSRVCQVTLTDVHAGTGDVLGSVGGGQPIHEAVLEHAAVAASAEMLGASRQCLEMATEYAKTREQFGQPIGTFQAVKHKLADMLLEVEQSHAAVYYGAWALSTGSDDASLAASVAKAYVSGASRKVCGDAIQAHGGIGFTWEYDLHLYFKRAKHYEPLFGDQDFHRERALAVMLNRRQALEAASATTQRQAVTAG